MLLEDFLKSASVFQSLIMSGTNSNSLTSIKDLKPGMNGINLQIIVLEIPRPTTTKDNQVNVLLFKIFF